MRLRFLCEEHRQRLAADPEAARALWLETAAGLVKDIPRPAPHDVSLAGSALEAAHIFLLRSFHCSGRLVERYAFTALHLIELLRRLGQPQLGIIVVAVATAMLDQLAHRQADGDAIESACLQITAAGRRIAGCTQGGTTCETSEVSDARTTLH